MFLDNSLVMQEFIKAAKAGDSSAWSMLYSQHKPWLYATALRICGNDPVAKDAVQDTFIQAFLKLSQLKDLTAFAGWLKTILVRNCYRNKQQKIVCDISSVGFDPGDYWEDEINKQLDLYAGQSQLYDALGNLSDSLQSVLLLRYFSSWQSYEQIAKILCVPVGTVRSRLNQAKQKMAERWLQNNDDDKALNEAREWDSIYHGYFENMYNSLSCRERFINHIDKNLQLIFTSGKTDYGTEPLKRMIEEDITYGIRLSNIQVMSSGAISIVEMQNINPAEHPDHCPESGVIVLYRNKNKVVKLNLHNS